MNCCALDHRTVFSGPNRLEANLLTDIYKLQTTLRRETQAYRLNSTCLPHEKFRMSMPVYFSVCLLLCL